MTEDQCSAIAKRLFKAIDQEGRKTMNKEQTIEFVSFLKEHLFHSSYREERDRPGVEAMFESLPGEEFELKLPNPAYPEYPIITKEKRIKFRPLYEAIYT